MVPRNSYTPIISISGVLTMVPRNSYTPIISISGPMLSRTWDWDKNKHDHTVRSRQATINRKTMRQTQVLPCRERMPQLPTLLSGPVPNKHATYTHRQLARAQRGRYRHVYARHFFQAHHTELGVDYNCYNHTRSPSLV